MLLSCLAPFRGVSLSHFLFHLIHMIRMFQVLRLPSWFPGMSFKRRMAIAHEYSKEYLERPFEYALQKAVMVISILTPARVQ